MQFLGLNQIIAAHFAKQNTNPVGAKSGGAAEGGRSGSDKPSGSKRCGRNSLACPSRSRALRGKMVAQFSKKALTGCFVFRKQNFNNDKVLVIISWF